MKIGILGGTFDPIHGGHLYLARTGLRVLGLERILFMVAHLSPHKARGERTSPYDRYAMVALELLDQPRFHPCRWELERGSLSFTIDTARHFISAWPGHAYCFLSGSDSLCELHLWKDHGSLLREFSFLFLQRPGAEVEVDRLSLSPDLRSRIHTIAAEQRTELSPGRSHLITLEAPRVSGTGVRRSIRSGLDPSPDVISPPVLRYIRKHRLYEGRKAHPDPHL